jgi:hypothetical protein
VNVDLETKSVISSLLDDAGRIARLFSMTIGHQPRLQTEATRLAVSREIIPLRALKKIEEPPHKKTCQNEIHSQTNLKPWLALCDSHPHIFVNPETCVEGLPRLCWVYNREFKVAQELKTNVTRIQGSGSEDTYLDKNFI